MKDPDNVAGLCKLADSLFLALIIKNGLTALLDAAPEHWQEEVEQDLLCCRASLHKVKQRLSLLDYFFDQLLRVLLS